MLSVFAFGVVIIEWVYWSSNSKKSGTMINLLQNSCESCRCCYPVIILLTATFQPFFLLVTPLSLRIIPYSYFVNSGKLLIGMYFDETTSLDEKAKLLGNVLTNLFWGQGHYNNSSAEGPLRDTGALGTLASLTKMASSDQKCQGLGCFGFFFYLIARSNGNSLMWKQLYFQKRVSLCTDN